MTRTQRITYTIVFLVSFIACSLVAALVTGGLLWFAWNHIAVNHQIDYQTAVAIAFCVSLFRPHHRSRNRDRDR